MGTDTNIQWTDSTWNPVRGCSRVSKGCVNCYAEKIAARFSGPGQPYEGLALRKLKVLQDGTERLEARWTGEVRMVPEHLADPLRWTRPRRVFVNSMSDLFHEKLADADIDRVWATMLLAPHHTFQVLTKRPERALKYLTAPGLYQRILRAADTIRDERPKLTQIAISDPRIFPAPWIWLGVSVEDQETADERIPHLLATPAAVRFVSYEPALAGIDFFAFLKGDVRDRSLEALRSRPMPGLDWVIVGGESGPGARPFDIAWARSTVEQCRAAGVACFVKQLGAVPVMNEATWRSLPAASLLKATNAGREPVGTVPLFMSNGKGGDPAEWPEDLRVREFPGSAS